MGVKHWTLMITGKHTRNNANVIAHSDTFPTHNIHVQLYIIIYIYIYNNKITEIQLLALQSTPDLANQHYETCARRTSNKPENIRNNSVLSICLCTY